MTRDQLRRELREAFEADNLLGFDTYPEAIQAVFTHPDYAQRWECSERLQAAVRAWCEQKTQAVLS